MKRIATLSCVIFLPGLGLSVLAADTNSVPARVQNAVPQATRTNNPALPANVDLSNGAQLRPHETAAMKRRAQEKALAAQRAKPDYNGEINAIFHPGNDQVGDTVIHDTIITVYPTGR
jgi:hypothetical protein